VGNITPPPVAYSPDNRCCQWLVNDGRPWFVCAAPRLSIMHPYCATHTAIACVRAGRPGHDSDLKTEAAAPLQQAVDAVPAIPAPAALPAVPTGLQPAPIARRYTTDGRRRWA